ncbi:MAG: hypothetical protein OXC30_01100 [Alphaproteobacteria bacterium]|nr:hypothetical protein [Alphaproteobacteria bacterium]
MIKKIKRIIILWNLTVLQAQGAVGGPNIENLHVYLRGVLAGHDAICSVRDRLIDCADFLSKHNDHKNITSRLSRDSADDCIKKRDNLQGYTEHFINFLNQVHEEGEENISAMRSVEREWNGDQEKEAVFQEYLFTDVKDALKSLNQGFRQHVSLAKKQMQYLNDLETFMTGLYILPGEREIFDIIKHHLFPYRHHVEEREKRMQLYHQNFKKYLKHENIFIKKSLRVEMFFSESEGSAEYGAHRVSLHVYLRGFLAEYDALCAVRSRWITCGDFLAQHKEHEYITSRLSQNSDAEYHYHIKSLQRYTVWFTDFLHKIHKKVAKNVSAMRAVDRKWHADHTKESVSQKYRLIDVKDALEILNQGFSEHVACVKKHLVHVDHLEHFSDSTFPLAPDDLAEFAIIKRNVRPYRICVEKQERDLELYHDNFQKYLQLEKTFFRKSLCVETSDSAGSIEMFEEEVCTECSQYKLSLHVYLRGFLEAHDAICVMRGRLITCGDFLAQHNDHENIISRLTQDGASEYKDKRKELQKYIVWFANFLHETHKKEEENVIAMRSIDREWKVDHKKEAVSQGCIFTGVQDALECLNQGLSEQGEDVSAMRSVGREWAVSQDCIFTGVQYALERLNQGLSEHVVWAEKQMQHLDNLEKFINGILYLSPDDTAVFNIINQNLLKYKMHVEEREERMALYRHNFKKYLQFENTFAQKYFGIEKPYEERCSIDEERWRAKRQKRYCCTIL